jgi:hypothetical protein
MNAPIWPWADSLLNSGWPWLCYASTSVTLAKVDDYHQAISQADIFFICEMIPKSKIIYIWFSIHLYLKTYRKIL